MLFEKLRNITDEIFFHEGFKNADTHTLRNRYDISEAIYGINAHFGNLKSENIQEENSIAAIPPPGIVINKSGTYVFTKDIVWQAADTALAGITITADNVILDLAGFTLQAIVQDHSQKIAGISIQQASTVSVVNGVLKDMCFYGIYAVSVPNLTIENVTVDGIRFHNLNSRNLSPAGIHVEKSKELTIRNCIIQNLDVTSDASAGIQIVGTHGAA